MQYRQEWVCLDCPAHEYSEEWSVIYKSSEDKAYLKSQDFTMDEWDNWLHNDLSEGDDRKHKKQFKATSTKDYSASADVLCSSPEVITPKE